MNKLRTELQNGLTIQEVCKKYKLTFYELFNQLKDSQQDEYYNYVSENIYKFGQRYIVQKLDGNKAVQYGSYIHYEEAVQVREELIEKNWEVDPLDYLGDKYIHCTRNRFLISKSFGRGNHKYYGYYRTLEDARKVRDCLVKMNWGKDYLNLILKQLGVERIGN